MKDKKLFSFPITFTLRTLALTALACVFFATCSFENPIIDKWWDDEPEIEYVPITKVIPQVTYETLTDHDNINKAVIQQLPPEVIYEQLPPIEIEKVVYEQLPPQIVYEQLPPEVIHEVVYEQLPPEVIHDVVYEQLPPQIVYVQLPPEVIYEQLPPIEIEKIVYEQLPPQVIYNTIINNITNNVISEQLTSEVINNLPSDPPSDDDIINLIKDKPDLIKEIVKLIQPDEIVKYLTDEQLKNVIQYVIDNNVLTEDQIKEIIKNIPSDEIVKCLTDDQITSVIQYVIDNKSLTEDQIKEIIKNIPPDELITYLTDEQIKYIIQQQPPQVILQTLKIIDIEYIIFAGNADVYNGPPGAGGNTYLTDQEKKSNDASVSAIAQALKKNPDYLIMLHGHANPVDFTDGETVELTKLSLDRANSVKDALLAQFKSINDGVDIDDSRVTVSGYGGEKVLFGNNTAYTALNRRVEMILVWVGVE